MKLVELITEEAGIYQGFVRITYTDGTTIVQLADLIRSIQGVTIVSTSTSDEQANIATFKVKIRTSKTGDEAFKFLRSTAIKYPQVSKFEIGTNTIERIK